MSSLACVDYNHFGTQISYLLFWAGLNRLVRDVRNAWRSPFARPLAIFRGCRVWVGRDRSLETAGRSARVSWFEETPAAPAARDHPQPTAPCEQDIPKRHPIPQSAEVHNAVMFEALDHDVHYTLSGPVHGRLIVLITAIGEPISTWMQLVNGISAQGFRVLSCTFRAHLEHSDEPSTAVCAQRFESLLQVPCD